ncbi:MAG: DNA gyrase inhibitor YacG [Candidatus Thiodiazotropha sp.]
MSQPSTPTRVPCPTCGKPVPWTPQSTWRPFCSERCRLIDLGDWLDENHRISEPLLDDEFEPPPGD